MLLGLKPYAKKNNIKAFSSNYTLYGDLSHRVMTTIEAHWPELEIYSIDEAFLDLTTLPQDLHTSFCESLQKIILRNTGIPTSIGIGATKTLAKAANFICKKILKFPVFKLDTDNKTIMQKIPVGDVWGIGRKWSEKLAQQGIHTAFDLAEVNAHHFKKQFTVVMMRTVIVVVKFFWTHRRTFLHSLILLDWVFLPGCVNEV